MISLKCRSLFPFIRNGILLFTLTKVISPIPCVIWSMLVVGDDWSDGEDIEVFIITLQSRHIPLKEENDLNVSYEINFATRAQINILS